MANKLYEENDIQAIADSIRRNAPNSTNGSTFSVGEMAQAVDVVYEEGYENGVASVAIGGKSFPVVETGLAVWNTIDQLRTVLRDNGVTENDICVARIAGSAIICQIGEINAYGEPNIPIVHWQELGSPYYTSTGIFGGVDPNTSISDVILAAQNQLKTEDKTITGAINELHDEIEALGENAGGGDTGGSSLEMPLIRFIGLRGDNVLSNLDGEEYPVQFMIEIIAGAVQVGDTLQICGMRTFCESPRNPVRKRKLRRFAEYVITEEDLDKRYLILTVNPTRNAFAHFRRTNRQSGGPAMYYFRIRRPVGDLQANDSGMTNSARFSNVVPVLMMNMCTDSQEDEDGNVFYAVSINIL